MRDISKYIVHKNKKSVLEKKDKCNWMIPIVLLYIGIWVLLFCNHLELKKGNSLQEGIAHEMIRFHVLANSDTEADQALKLKVKNKIIEELEEPLKDSENKEEARIVLENEMSNIIETAQEVILAEGYGYHVEAALSDVYFPTKIYGDMTFPPGVYQALQIKIGEAKGKNWWCVMFPPLCFVEGTYSVVPEESKIKLEQVLTEEEYTSLVKEGKVKVKPKSKLLKILKKWK